MAVVLKISNSIYCIQFLIFHLICLVSAVSTADAGFNIDTTRKLTDTNNEIVRSLALNVLASLPPPAFTIEVISTNGSKPW